jgi:hypothetical protein
MSLPDEERFRLTVPIAEAVSFAMGLGDLDGNEPSDHARQLIGLLAIDQLEYSEEWRAAAIVRSGLREKWPELHL